MCLCPHRVDEGTPTVPRRFQNVGKAVESGYRMNNPVFPYKSIGIRHTWAARQIATRPTPSVFFFFQPPFSGNAANAVQLHFHEFVIMFTQFQKHFFRIGNRISGNVL